MLIIPLPRLSVLIKSEMFSSGSPKNTSPPSASRRARFRWMEPTLADEIFPYLVVNCARLSPTYCSIFCKSFRSISNKSFSSAILKINESTAPCVSLSISKRSRSSGPSSETVVLTGCPCSPNTSQNCTGQDLYSKPFSASLNCVTRFVTLSLFPPTLATPERSPFISAAKTGTPILLKVSASTCKLIVLPVPVAPVINPWRLAIFGIKQISFSSLIATNERC